MNKEEIIKQLKIDEGFVPVAKWDNKQYSYGYGCRANGAGAKITEKEASLLLRRSVETACAQFEQIFFGHRNKFNDVRENAFVNMVFNMGPGKKGHPECGGLQSFVKTLALIVNNEVVPWGQVANELRDSGWYHQVGNRAVRIVNEVKTGIKAGG